MTVRSRIPNAGAASHISKRPRHDIGRPLHHLSGLEVSGVGARAFVFKLALV